MTKSRITFTVFEFVSALVLTAAIVFVVARST